MPDLYSPEDEATLYVLGELSDSERREFEARLRQSPELRSLVRELEEGAVALSMASTRRRPPAEVWMRIEQEVAGRTRRKVFIPASWTGWWRNGWAAAAVCLAGLLYVLLAHRPGSSDAFSSQVAPAISSQSRTSPAPIPQDGARNMAPPGNAESNAALQLLQSRLQENTALRWQIAELTNQMTHLSQAFTQQQGLLSESSRLKFFQLGSPSGSNGTTAPVSPALQRALVLAMARELGWAPTSSEAGGKEGTREWPTNAASSSATNHASVDFVDLRQSSNSLPAFTGQPQTELAQTGEQEPSPVASASTNVVPGFVSGTNAVLAFDSSVVPTGSSLSFLTATSSGQFQSLGATVLGRNPLVVTIPLGSPTWAGGNITVIAGTPNGSTNVLGQFPVPGTISP